MKIKDSTHLSLPECLLFGKNLRSYCGDTSLPRKIRQTMLQEDWEWISLEFLRMQYEKWPHERAESDPVTDEKPEVKKNLSVNAAVATDSTNITH